MVATLRSRLPFKAFFALAGSFVFVSSIPTLGQVTVSAQTAPTLAGYVSSSSRIFVTVNRLEDLDRTLTRAKASRLLSVLGGKPATEGSSDFKTTIQSLVGASALIPAEDLMKCEVGLAAESLAQLANPVWLVRAVDDDMLRRWFPQHAPTGPEADSARVFRADDGRFVCIRDKVVALAPRASDWAQLGSMLRAMTGSDPDALERLPAYRESIAYLPSRSLATIYIARATRSSGLDISSAGHVAIGVYAKGETIDLAFRGSRMTPLGKGPIAPAAFERMLKLPQTTLGAYTTTVDWASLSERQDNSAGTLLRYIRLLKDLSKDDSNPDATAPRMGRHLILAWGQDFSPGGFTPQIAALVETSDASVMGHAALRVSESLSRILSTLELRDVSQDLKVMQRTHLGISISSIPLQTWAEKSRFPWVKALGALEPTWAASGDWFVVTLTADHMNRILDAQIGFLSTLADATGELALRGAPAQSISTAILQGSLASETIQQWETKLRAVHAEEFVRTLWSRGRSPTSNGNRLGIELADDGAFGLVEVAAVAVGSPAHGRLEPGDLIIGVDGRLLEMVDPEVDLQRWWEDALAGSLHTLRVLRGESTVELEVTRRHDEISLADLFDQPLDVLHELAILCDAIPSAILQIHHTSDQHFSALLSLRLSLSK